MKDEIKEIDITKDLYLCSPLLNTECSKENCYINNGPCYHTVNKEHSQQHLLDYITNLQTIEQQYSAILSENAELEQKYDIALEDNVKESKRRMELQEEKNNMACLVNDLQEKIDEAIKYIEFEQKYSIPYKEELIELSNILQGKSDE